MKALNDAARTEWFPPEVKPIRKGWYECKSCNRRHYWNGERWPLYGTGESNYYPFKWRGLAKKP